MCRRNILSSRDLSDVVVATAVRHIKPKSLRLRQNNVITQSRNILETLSL